MISSANYEWSVIGSYFKPFTWRRGCECVQFLKESKNLSTYHISSSATISPRLQIVARCKWHDTFFYNSESRHYFHLIWHAVQWNPLCNYHVKLQARMAAHFCCKATALYYFSFFFLSIVAFANIGHIIAEVYDCICVNECSHDSHVALLLLCENACWTSLFRNCSAVLLTSLCIKLAWKAMLCTLMTSPHAVTARLSATIIFACFFFYSQGQVYRM